MDRNSPPRGSCNCSRFEAQDTLQRSRSLGSAPKEMARQLSHPYTACSADPGNPGHQFHGMRSSSAQDDPELVIDHPASTRQGYIDAERHILISSRKLDVVYSTQRIAPEFDIPSCIPKWAAADKQRRGSPVVSLSLTRRTLTHVQYGKRFHN